MKKTIYLLLFFNKLLLAQVLNGNFEQVNSNLTLKNWGMNFEIPSQIDPNTGETIHDEILYTNASIPSMVYATTDSYSGNYAMVVSNAYNETQNYTIPGKAIIHLENTNSVLEDNVPVTENDNISMLGFFYKFIPIGNDKAEAKIKVFDSDNNTIGEAAMTIQNTNNFYNYIYTPINYYSNAVASSISITFRMDKNSSSINWGSILIVDNVVTNFSALNIEQFDELEKWKVYPTITSDYITIESLLLEDKKVNLSLYNSFGQEVEVKKEIIEMFSKQNIIMSHLPKGIYFLTLERNNTSITKKIIKN